MATRFEPLQLDAPGIFGVRLHGAFGRGDRQRFVDLAERCIEKRKSRLVLDCRDLDSLGGGGAAVLADLQARLVELDGEMVFVAAGEVIRRFLQNKFGGLPLRFFATVAEAIAGFGSTAAPEAAAGGSAGRRAAVSAGDGRSGRPADLDRLLESVAEDDERPDDQVRRTADLVTAAYISLADVLRAVEAGSNPTVMGEALGMLLDSHDLAAETIYCHARGEHYAATVGDVRLPAAGGIVAGLLRTRRPLTLLDLEDGALWDEESQLLEDLQPDLILPLIRGAELAGVAFLRRGGEDREYGISEIFALELLLHLLALEPSPGPDPADPADPAAAQPRPACASGPQPGADGLLAVKLELMRGMSEAQDLPHFWQVFISRLREVAEVTSLAHLEGAEAIGPAYLAGEARRGLDDALLTGERIQAFFRTLARPVEIVNMPSSLEKVRNMLLGCGLQWLVPLRADGSRQHGVVALGLNWRGHASDSDETLLELVEIAAEALQRLREVQNRADMSVGLLEDLLVDGRPGGAEDPVNRELARSVRILARELGLTHDQERDLVLGALLRNHGQDRQDVDDRTADRLTGADWEQYRGHPDLGERRLASLRAPQAVRDAVRHHHERFDGRGFPLGLQGRDIPLAARLVAVAQCRALNLLDGDDQAALAAVKREAGKALDPDLVEIFLKAARREQAVPAAV